MIPTLSATSAASTQREALEEHGCLVLTDAFSAESAAAIRAELAAPMAAARVVEEDDPEEFYPGQTRRVTGLLARSPTVSTELVAHPSSLKVCDDFLLPNGEFGYQLHVTAALEVGPGAREQVLQRREI